MSKEEIIKKVYNEFHGSINSVYQDAKKEDNTIKLKDVQNYFNKTFVKKNNLKGYNSFIAKYPHHEYQADLFFINDLEDQEYTIGLLMIDIFSKFLTVVVVKSKAAEDILNAIKEGFDNMGEYPEMLYTDDEGSFHSKQAEEFYKKHNINHIITRGHAPYAERAIRTIKNMIYKRLESKPDAKWYSTEILSNALVVYNYKMKSSITGMTPIDAKKKSNLFEVKTKLEINKVSKRKYPDIKENDEVRIYTKKKNFQKERVPVWSLNKYTVNKIVNSHGQDYYYLDGYNKPMLRHEILKI